MLRVSLLFLLILSLIAVFRWLVGTVINAKRIDPSSPKSIGVFASSHHASIIVAKLSEHGIKATVVGGLVSAFGAELPGRFDVMVSQQDVENAQELLGSWKEPDANHDGNFE